MWELELYRTLEPTNVVDASFSSDGGVCLCGIQCVCVSVCVPSAIVLQDSSQANILAYSVGDSDDVVGNVGCGVVDDGKEC